MFFSRTKTFTHLSQRLKFSLFIVFHSCSHLFLVVFRIITQFFLQSCFIDGLSKTMECYLIVKPAHAHLQFLFIKIYLKFLKTLLHVSVIRPSSGNFQFLAKITLINIYFDIPVLKLTIWQHVVLCVELCSQSA